MQLMVNLQKTRAEGSHVSFTELLSDKRHEFEEEDKRAARLTHLEGHLGLIQSKQQATIQALRAVREPVLEMVAQFQARKAKGTGNSAADTNAKAKSR